MGASAILPYTPRNQGRTLFTAQATGVSAVTTEALLTLTRYRDLSAGSSGTSLGVTSGKILVIQSIIVAMRQTSSVANSVILALRLLAGTVQVSSPAHAEVAVGGPAPGQASNYWCAQIKFPEGLQLSGSMQLGVSHLGGSTSGGMNVDAFVNGFEYSP